MRRFIQYGVMTAFLMVLAGCQSVSSVFHSSDTSDNQSVEQGTNDQGIVQREPFPVSEYQQLARSGHSSISGQVVVKVDGNTQGVTGPEVLAVPVTSYSRQAYEALKSNRKISSADPRAQKYTLRTLGDDSGNFRFNDLAAGSYYLITKAQWTVRQGAHRIAKSQVVQREISVGNGETAKATLSP